MPSKKVCASKYGAGTKAYKDCINYRKGVNNSAKRKSKEE